MKYCSVKSTQPHCFQNSLYILKCSKLKKLYNIILDTEKSHILLVVLRKKKEEIADAKVDLTKITPNDNVD